jgi:hypothetical protein
MTRKSGTGRQCFGLTLLFCLTLLGGADSLAGHVIDKTNWREAEGLLPEPHLNWLKEGKIVIDLGELSYDPSQYFTRETLERNVSNAGKYDIDAEGWIIETATGKPAKHIIGFPFPKIDMEDPKAGEKIMHNKIFTWYTVGNGKMTYKLLWIGSNLERSIDNRTQLAPLQGWPGVEKVPNREGFEKLGVSVVTAPVDLKGASNMTWRYLSPNKKDSTFVYVPMTRRVRQISPANRSDAAAGSDMCLDDSNGYDGKVQAFAWKLLRQQQAIVPYIDKDLQPLERTEKGEWATTRQQKILVLGYEKGGWQGAPWAVTNYLWIKRPVYVIEARARDPYYNYGLQYFWIDTETYAAFYKVIYDRSGDYWKASFSAFSGYRSPGDEIRMHGLSHGAVVDDRRSHATGTELISPRHIVTINIDLDLRDFSLAGFQKYCK